MHFSGLSSVLDTTLDCARDSVLHQIVIAIAVMLIASNGASFGVVTLIVSLWFFSALTWLAKKLDRVDNRRVATPGLAHAKS